MNPRKLTTSNKFLKTYCAVEVYVKCSECLSIVLELLLYPCMNIPQNMLDMISFLFSIILLEYNILKVFRVICAIFCQYRTLIIYLKYRLKSRKAQFVITSIIYDLILVIELALPINSQSINEEVQNLFLKNEFSLKNMLNEILNCYNSILIFVTLQEYLFEQDQLFIIDSEFSYTLLYLKLLDHIKFILTYMINKL